MLDVIVDIVVDAVRAILTRRKDSNEPQRRYSRATSSGLAAGAHGTSAGHVGYPNAEPAPSPWRSEQARWLSLAVFGPMTAASAAVHTSFPWL